MIDLVIDASAGVDLLLDTVSGRALLAKLPSQARWWAPEHYLVEVAATLRRAELNGVAPELGDVGVVDREGLVGAGHEVGGDVGECHRERPVTHPAYGPPDNSMTGVDQFLVALGKGPHVFCYLVDPNGELQHLGRGLLTAPWMAEMNGPAAQTDAPPGWHPDPTGRHHCRYWDGRSWSEYAATDGAVVLDPLRP